MLGDYVLHFPLTDFAVSLVVVAAVLDIAWRVLRRPRWEIAVDLSLALGLAGALAAVGSGLWLVASTDAGHSDQLSLHHWFAYSALAMTALAGVARLLRRRSPKMHVLQTAALVVAAALVSAAGYYGGAMAHGHADAPAVTDRADAAHGAPSH